jgi:hypothetical protein
MDRIKDYQLGMFEPKQLEWTSTEIYTDDQENRSSEALKNN